MPCVQSCIVADPPEYRVPVQTRPVLNQFKATPEPSKVLVIYTTGRTGMPTVGASFNVPVRSEDAGEDLRAILFLDYQVPRPEGATSSNKGQSKIVSQKIDASTYSSTGRAFAYPWVPDSANVSQGCHFVTLIVAHRGSFQGNDEDRLDPSKAAEDAAFLTWTVNVDPPTDAVNNLINCPTSTSTAQ